MPAQTVVRQFLTSGLPGEIANTGPSRAHDWVVQVSGLAVNNIVGYAYAQLSDGIATPGQNGNFIGVLVLPKNYALLGTPTGSLEPAFFIPDNQNGSLLSMGEIWVSLQTAGNVGDGLTYNIDTGAISSAIVTPPDASNFVIPTGKIIEQDIPSPGLAKVRLTD